MTANQIRHRCAPEAASSGGRRVRVLIVDDSLVMRLFLTEILKTDPQIEVVGTARDAYDARHKIKELAPDVLTLDVALPRMCGVTFLRNLMRLRPMPVVVISSLTRPASSAADEALAAGAIHVVHKAELDVSQGPRPALGELLQKIKSAAATATVVTDINWNRTQGIVAIGASTGGTEAIKQLLQDMEGVRLPPVVVVQHIPKRFSSFYAARLNRTCSQQVCEARDSEPLKPDHVYVAPGDAHLKLQRVSGGVLCRLDSGERVNRHRPSVDVMFKSVAQLRGINAVGVILTGMGRDGASGLNAMHDAGATTIAQDEQTSIVWGMPGAAVQLGAVDHVLSLDRIGDCIVESLACRARENAAPR